MNDKHLNNWKIVNRCADGDFSVVYKAVSEDGSVCAIKEMSLPRTGDDMDTIIKAGIASSYEEAATFFAQAIKNELDLLKKFKGNPNILDYYEFSQNFDENHTSAKYYIRMEYADDIKTHFKTNGVSQHDVVKLGIDICSALELFLNNNITHNDIKPGNIFIDKNGNYKLGDFGIATKLGGNNFVPFGTLNYISPEVYYRKGTLNNSDLYSLGLVMYKLLAGNLPFVSQTVTERKAIEMRMSGTAVPVIEDIDKSLMDIVIKACDFNPSNRYNNVIEMKNALMSLSNISTKKNTIIFASSATERTISIYDKDLLMNQKNNLNIKMSKEKIKNEISKNQVFKKVILNIFLIVLLISGIQVYRFNRTCGEGKINKYGKCVSGYYYCDTDYFLKGKKCLKIIESKNAKVRYTCKSGYTLKDEMCINNDIREPKPALKCAVDGFTLNTNTNKCEMTISGDASPQLDCSGNDCLVASNITYKCPDSSYKLNGTKCSKSTNVNTEPKKEYSCAEGGILSGINCNFAIPPTKSGFGWMGSKPTCSKGEYSYTDQKCHYTEPAIITYKCGNHVVRENTRCNSASISTIDATPEYSCNSGYTLVLDSNMCVKTTNVTKYVCPDNAVLRGNKCYSTNTMDAVNVYECDDGFVLAGTSCVKNEEVKAVKKYTCSKVYTLNGDKCEKYNEKPAKAHYNK